MIRLIISLVMVEKGTSGSAIVLQVNQFPIHLGVNGTFFQYEVVFSVSFLIGTNTANLIQKPEIDKKPLRRGLIGQHEKILGWSSN